MLTSPSRKLAAGAALILLAALAVLPVASAASEPTGEAACPLLPLWDAAFCWAGVASNLVAVAWETVTCDVVGGPACGFDLCDDAGICPTRSE